MGKLLNSLLSPVFTGFVFPHVGYYTHTIQTTKQTFVFSSQTLFGSLFPYTYTKLIYIYILYI
jgi:hypothetical protein